MAAYLYVWVLAIFVSLGAGFFYGYDAGAINGVKDMDGFREAFNISREQNGNDSSSCASDDDVETIALIGLIVSVFPIGALAGALVAGVAADKVGRKPAVIVGAVLYCIGGVMQAAAYHIWMILVGRVIVGSGYGFNGVAGPPYIAEISPKSQRGRLVSFVALSTAVGVLVGFCVDLVCEKYTFGWRIALGLEGLLGAVFALVMCSCPETPRWLMKRGRKTKAAKVLLKIHRNRQKVEEELKEMQNNLEGAGKQSFHQDFKAFLRWTVIHRVIIGGTLQMFNIIAGYSAVIYYSVTIFCDIQVQPYIASIVVGVVSIVGVVMTQLTIDKLGRKTLLLVGAACQTLSLVLAGTLAFYFEEQGKNDILGFAFVVAVCAYILSTSWTFLSVIWSVDAEIHPSNVRGLSRSLTNAVYWSAAVVATQTTPLLLSSDLQTHGTFYVLAGLNALAFIFVLTTVPETKGLSLEQLEKKFDEPWLKRTDIMYYIRCGLPWRLFTSVIPTAEQYPVAATNPITESDIVEMYRFSPLLLRSNRHNTS